jgi:hypothetical membrane protein
VNQEVMSEGAGNLSHCPISRCYTEPGYCQEAVDAEELVAVSAIILVPLAIAFLTPLLTRTKCRHKDDDTVNEHIYHQVDPPMFLCGIGLLPLDCGLSGLLTVIAVFAAAIVVVFYSMLLSERPCTTALGQCRTISCACGNAVEQGYVFMFALLSLTSTILVQRFSRMTQHHRLQHRTLKPLLITGSVLLTFTGIFPEQYDANGGQSGFLSVFYSLHLFGVFGSGLLLLGVPYMWFLEHYLTHRKQIPRRSIMVRTVYFCATFACALFQAAASSASVVADSTVDFCSQLSSREQCEGWPMLPADACAQADACIRGNFTNLDLCAGVHQPNFNCSWVPIDKFSKWTQLIAPASYLSSASCIRSSCPIYKYARGVALEFALLFLTLCYVASFGLHDVRRLFDRRPPERRGSAVGAHTVDGFSSYTDVEGRGIVPAETGSASGATPPLLASDRRGV